MIKRMLAVVALALFALAASPAIDGSVFADPPKGDKRTCPPC